MEPILILGIFRSCIQMDHSYCPNCGEKLTDSPSFCPKCGTPLDEGSPVSQNRRADRNRSSDFDPKDRMMRLVWAIVVIFIFMLVFGGYHYVKTFLGFP